MVERPVIEIVRRYLEALPRYGIHAKKGVPFGSFAAGRPHEWSDIDLVVIAPEFDQPDTIELVKHRWRAPVAADNRIEPIACGEREWETDDARPVLEIVCRQGIDIAA